MAGDSKDKQKKDEYIKELIDYVKKRQNQDPLVMGFENVKANNPLRREPPYKCIIS